MTLLYWREYQTIFILVKFWYWVRANCYRNIKLNWDILIKTLIFNNLLVKALINDYFNE
ncbi:hypothetical protein [Spiroplasma poulsonii]|uniref:hypothetical protein n=1 Tax=Spiroplasma poulsonii TaxID=2138 RepID=UPI001F4C80C9|nr:hypothetical protein [Spiroplasma poulsonii]UNF62626.1 hypothetical protein MNU24_04035 [Spiroplasma poulsonii]